MGVSLILVNRYADHYDWKPMAGGLTEAFKDWPGPVSSRWMAGLEMRIGTQIKA